MGSDKNSVDSYKVCNIFSGGISKIIIDWFPVTFVTF